LTFLSPVEMQLHKKFYWL